MNQIIPEIVSQHAEEAAFLWLLRDAATLAPHYALKDLAKLDGRVEAHLDGLRVNGDPAWEICKEAAAAGPGEVFAAAVLAFESGKEDRIQAVVKAGTASLAKTRGLVSALGWLPWAVAAAHVQTLHGAASPIVRRIGIAAAAIHRQVPKVPLQNALTDNDYLLRARALRAVGELAVADHRDVVKKSLASKDQACRFWAAWSMARLFGDPEAVAVLQSVALVRGPYQLRALQIVLRVLDPAAVRNWHLKLTLSPGLQEMLLVRPGVLGEPESVPWLIDQMKVPASARLAGESFSMITGAHISYDNLEGEPPEGFEAGPTESPQDDHVALDPNENLYWPNPEAVRKWWEGRKGDFAIGVRYLLGKPITSEWLRQALRDGYQRQRAAAALELAVRERGSPLFEVRAPAADSSCASGKPA